MTNAEKIQSIRRAHNLTQFELAEKLGVTRQTVGRWEKGLKEPSAIEMAGIVNLFDNDVKNSTFEEPIEKYQKVKDQEIFYLKELNKVLTESVKEKNETIQLLRDEVGYLKREIQRLNEYSTSIEKINKERKIR